MEYARPELILIGQAESLILGGPSGMGDPGSAETSHAPSILEFED
jgi:hypothetical protein